MQNWQEESKFMAIKEVSERYLELRQNALDYTFEQMNLQLENDKQVYLAVFDIPVESAIILFLPFRRFKSYL